MRFRLLAFVFFILFYTSCVKRTDINPIPTIDYVSFFPQDETVAYLTISYKDGDGDIFAEEGTKDYNYFAFFYYKDATGNFVQDETNVIVGVIERPSELSKDQPIRGEITRTLTGWRSNSIYKNFKYKIFMFDQKGNKTNELMTPEIISPF
jgi:hypothetical protein